MSPPEICPPGYIAVETDVHPDEWTSGEAYDLHELLLSKPIDGIWTVRANESTLLRNRRTGCQDRYTDYNLQTVSPAYAASNPDAYEVRRHQYLQTAVAAARIVIETHSHLGSEPYAWYDVSANSEVRGVASALDMRRSVFVQAPNMKYGYDNRLSVEFTTARKDTYLDEMYELLQRLARGERPVPGDLEEYRFVGDVSVDEARRIGLPDEHTPWTAFSADDQEKLKRHGLPPDAIPICWSYELYGSRHGCIGELAVPAASVMVL